MLRVSTISPRDVRELFRVRAALEGLGVAEIIASPERATAAATLRAALSELTDTDGDFATKLEADLGFHLLLCQLSGNAMLMEAWRYLEGRIRVTIMNCETDNTPSMMARARHAPIVEAIERGDVEAAKSVVEHHMAAAAKQYAPTDRAVNVPAREIDERLSDVDHEVTPRPDEAPRPP